MQVAMNCVWLALFFIVLRVEEDVHIVVNVPHKLLCADTSLVLGLSSGD